MQTCPAGVVAGLTLVMSLFWFIAALDKANWVLAGPNGAAARLGIKRSTLQFRMRKLGIVRPALQH